MPQSFRCPSCAAPLEFAGGASNFQKCEFCGNQIIIPAEVFQAGATNANFGVGSLLNQAHKLKEIKSLALSGQTIPAIKIYRETFGVGLKEAKDAVENIIAGKPVVFTSVQAKTAANFADSSSYVASDRQTQKLSEAERLIMDGNKIGAIKLLRDDFGIGLAEAKNIADRISDGKSVSLSELQHRPSLEKTTKNGSSFGKTLFFLLFIALTVGGIVYYGVNFCGT